MEYNLEYFIYKKMESYMALDFFSAAAKHAGIGLANIFCNGFDTQLSKGEKKEKIRIRPSHFVPVNRWIKEQYAVVDQTNQDRYNGDPKKMVRMKCAALFGASFLTQPLGLLLNLINRIGKVVTFAHLWHPSNEKYSFTARLAEMGEDICESLAPR